MQNADFAVFCSSVWSVLYRCKVISTYWPSEVLNNLLSSLSVLFNFCWKFIFFSIQHILLPSRPVAPWSRSSCMGPSQVKLLPYCKCSDQTNVPMYMEIEIQSVYIGLVQTFYAFGSECWRISDVIRLPYGGPTSYSILLRQNRTSKLLSKLTFVWH